MRYKNLTALKMNVDPSPTYIPSGDAEIELLLKDAQLNAPIYQHAYDAKKKRIDIIYRKPVQTLQGMQLYKLKTFTIENDDFDLSAFKSFFSACFPTAKVARLTMNDARELCNTAIVHLMQQTQ